MEKRFKSLERTEYTPLSLLKELLWKMCLKFWFIPIYMHMYTFNLLSETKFFTNIYVFWQKT